MTSQDIPKPLFPRKGEPIGWDFQEVRYWEEPIPETWWFIPWANTEHCDNSSRSYNSGGPKLLYFHVKDMEEEYLGSGIIVEETQGEIIGCYKVRAETEAGREMEEELHSLKAKMRFEEETGQSAEITERTARPELKEVSIPNSVRTLNGLLLDRRPAAIAYHEIPVFVLQSDMIDHSYKTYGDQYLPLEDEIRKAMGDTFDEDDDLPLFRKKQIKAADLDLTDEEVVVVDDDETQDSEDTA